MPLKDNKKEMKEATQIHYTLNLDDLSMISKQVLILQTMSVFNVGKTWIYKYTEAYQRLNKLVWQKWTNPFKVAELYHPIPHEL